MNYLQILHFNIPEIVEARVPGPQNERANARSHLPFFGPLPHLLDPPADLISALKLRVLGDLFFSRRRVTVVLPATLGSNVVREK